MKTDDFFIGYLPKMPPSAFRAVGAAVAVAIAFSILASMLGVGFQRRFDRSFFDFGNVREFRGTIRTGAVPFLIAEPATGPGSVPMSRRYALVAEGKHGFDAADFDGRAVTLRGTLISRDGFEMIEVESGSVNAVGGGSDNNETVEKLGRYSLRGEIVDSKCYLGVMNPGRSKPHRDCAVACIRGGVPPLFYVTDADGNVAEIWLTAANGEQIGPAILDYVAEPVEITGDLELRADQLFFRVNPEEIKR